MIEPAALAWRDGQPFSQAFGDIYHDRDGRREVERVFLEPAGFDALLHGRPRLLVGELGFGTGLNFAVVARRCLAASVPVHFVSFEAAPIAPEDFLSLARSRARDEPIYDDLAGCYPPLIHGWHRRRLAGGRVTLSVYWGDAQRGLGELARRQQTPFDLWLLDGFAPDRNESMWTEALLAQVAATSSRGTRVTTFTAAGRVRRGLAAQGFAMRRVDQRPHKRESLAGTLQRPGLPRRAAPDRATVVGAGIAGAAAARELADAGVEVRVLDAAPAVAAGASGTPVTVMHPRLHHDGSNAASLRATAFAHALAACRGYLDESPGSGLRRTGALQVASPNYPAERLAAVAACYAGSGINLEWLESRAASELAGVRIDAPALFFPDVCCVDTPRLCRTLLDHPRIRVELDSRVDGWPAGPAILACGTASRNFPGAQYLELAAVHGQLDLVRATAAPLTDLRVPLVGQGYVAPAAAATDQLAVGATYEYSPWPAATSRAHNLAHLDRIDPSGYTATGSHRATRCVSSDRNPVIGNLYSLDGQLQADRYTSSGHGSMGTISAHLGAALLDAALWGDATPLCAQLVALVSPLRFRQRQARRGYRFGASA